MDKPRIREYSIAIIFSCIGAPIMTYLSCQSCANNFFLFFKIASMSSAMWATMWIGNSELTQQISARIPWVKFPMKRFMVGLISTVAFTSVVAIGMLRFWEYIQDIRFGSYVDFIQISLIITFFISFFLHGREFLLNWKQSAVEVEKYQKESLAAQYESLKSQVNPHFLFNSLNVLTNLVYTDQDKAAQFIKKMSEVYRYVLDTRNRELVELEEELSFTSSYLYLQQIRFGNNLRINNQLQNKTGKVIPLAIQMLIENAIKHNEISTEYPLDILLVDRNGCIEVSNKIQLRTNPLEDKTGLGLVNIKKRYEFLCDKPVEVIHDQDFFTVRVPLILDDE